MTPDTTNCSVCSGRIGILPTAKSVTCPHCNAYQTISRRDESIDLKPAEKFADAPERKEFLETQREIDRLDLNWAYERRTYEMSQERRRRGFLNPLQSIAVLFGGRIFYRTMGSLFYSVYGYFTDHHYDNAREKYEATRQKLLRRGRK